jgi:hypothetical protein
MKILFMTLKIKWAAHTVFCQPALENLLLPLQKYDSTVSVYWVCLTKVMPDIFLHSFFFIPQLFLAALRSLL